MEDKNLKNIRKKYKEFLEIKETYQKLLQRKNELENDPKIQEYLNLIESIDSYGDTYILGCKVCSTTEKKLLERAFESEVIENSNNIFVYCGTYKVSDEIDIVHGPSDIRVKRDDPSAEYSTYRDIEKNSLNSSINVSIHCRDEFEKNNFILYPKGYTYENFYFEVRRKFFETAIKKGQKKAIEIIKSMK